MNTEFYDQLTHLINSHSLESGSNTSDRILAGYLMNCLYAFETAVQTRDGQLEIPTIHILKTESGDEY